MQKKIGALFIMAMFIISMVPFALAQKPSDKVNRLLEVNAEGDDADDTENIEIPDADEIMNEPEAKRVGLCVEKIRNELPKVLPEKAKAVCDKEFKGKMLGLNKEFNEKFKEKAKEYKEFKETHGKRMEIAKEKIEKAKQKFAEAKEKYNKAKENLEKSKEKFNDAKNLYQACNTNATGDECKAAKDAIKESWRGKLLNTADIMVEHFEKMKSKVESNDRLTEEEQNKTIAWIDAKIAEANTIKTEIQNAQTKDELVAAAKKLQDLWAKSKVKAKGYAGRIVTDKFAGILQQSKQLEVKLDRVMEKMEANGKNVTEVQDLVDKFHADVKGAEDHFKVAKEKFLSMENDTESEVPADYEALKNEAQAEITEAKKSLDSARDTLRQILEKIRTANGTEELASTTDEETEDAADAATA